MTISQKIVQSLQAANKESPLKKEEEDDIFDLDEHLKSVSKNILLERITFVEAKNSDHFDLSKLKSKYVVLNPKRATEDQKMSPALKATTHAPKESKHDGIPHPKTVLFSPERVELSWKKAIRAGAGMANLGNTCFLNSSLQCLSYTAPLANYLLHSDHRKHCVLSGQQFCMLCAMQQHLHHIHTNAGHAVKPMYILKNLRMIAKHLQFGRQEDAHEFIRYSVDAMQKSCLAGYSSKIDVHIKATTVVHQIFGGYLRSRVKCSQCKRVSDTYDPFLDLSLDINKQGCIDLQRCLEMFVQIEFLQGDNAYKCIHCRTTVQACKKFSIHRAPNVLMMQLKRFSNFMGSKINKELSYPSKLNLGPYMSNKPEGGLWYELYAVLVHSGFSCQSGHYYNYAKAPNGQWYCFNDSSVHQVSINQVLNQQAYLLFYSRNSKTSHHPGNLKQSVNKHGMSSMHAKQFNGGKPVVANGTKDRAPSELRKALSKPIIGPQLPPNFKSQRSYAFQSTSSSSDTGSPVAKNLNENVRKSMISSTEASSVPSNRPPLQFNFNKKSKLKKLDNGVGQSKEANFAHISGNGFGVKYNSKKGKEEERKVVRPANDIAKANGSSSHMPILGKVLKSEGGPSTSSATAPKKTATVSTVKLAPSSALTSLASYSSDEDDENTDEDKDGKESSSSSSALYSSISSTLKQLRKSVTKTQNGDANAEAASGSSANASAGRPSRDQNNNKIAGNAESNHSDKSTAALITSPGQKAKIGDPVISPKAAVSAVAKREDFSSPKAAIRSLSTQKSPAANIPPSPVKSSSLRKLLSGPQTEREPILDMLNNEINSDDMNACAPIAKAEPDDISAPGTPDSESFRRKKHKLPQERGRHKHKKERKRHYSSESDGSSSETNKKKKHFRPTSSGLHSSCSSLPAITDREYPLTPSKKRKRDQSYSRSRDDIASHKNGKDKREWRSGASSSGNTDTDSSNLSPKKKKKPERRDLCDHKDRKRTHSNGVSKLNGRTDDLDRYSSVDDLYCESTQYEEIRKRKEREERKRAMKEKKKRMKERRMLQHSIDDDEARSHSAGRDDRPKADSTKCGEKSHTKSLSHSDDNSLNSRCENGREAAENPVKKNSHPSNGKLPRTQSCSFETATTKERPNILAQLLKQSSGKAYGSKVKTWNGDDSLVEKDARETWKEQRAPLLDEWDREHDREKTKKIKRKHSDEKPGRISNLFQRFQNMKNQKWGGV